MISYDDYEVTESLKNYLVKLRLSKILPEVYRDRDYNTEYIREVSSHLLWTLIENWLSYTDSTTLQCDVNVTCHNIEDITIV